MLMNAAQSVLLLIDVQEKLAPATLEAERTVENCRKLTMGARRLDVPILASEHCPEGIGHLVAPLASEIPDGAIVEKTHFSAMREPAFATRFRELGRGQAVVCGMESHVCVMQTALTLHDEGIETFVVGDAVSSRHEENKTRALARMAGRGIGIVTVEMVLFEWLHHAGRPEFKDVFALIR